MTSTPKARIVDATRPDVRTVYRVDGVKVGGVVKAYRVVTYPASDLVFVESAETGRVVSAGVARNLIPILKAAIADLVDSLAEEYRRMRADPMLRDGMMNVDVDGRIERRRYHMAEVAPTENAGVPILRAEPELLDGEFLIWRIGSPVPIVVKA